MVSLVGKNAEGFFNALTDKTKLLGGTWRANKLAQLDNYVTGLLKLEIDENALENFKQMTEDFEDITFGFHEELSEETQACLSVHLTIECEDRQGLTSDITKLLLDKKVLVDHFESQRYPVEGLEMEVFEAQLEVKLPTILTVEQLVSDLKELNDRMQVFFSSV